MCEIKHDRSERAAEAERDATGEGERCRGGRLARADGGARGEREQNPLGGTDLVRRMSTQFVFFSEICEQFDIYFSYICNS